MFDLRLDTSQFKTLLLLQTGHMDMKYPQVFMMYLLLIHQVNRQEQKGLKVRKTNSGKLV